MRVALIVTGELERAALHGSLHRAFPEHTFHVEAKLDAVDPGRNGTASDLAMVVDDLEIANLDQPHVVVETFRDAVDRYVASAWATSSRCDRARALLRERASSYRFCARSLSTWPTGSERNARLRPDPSILPPC